MPPATICAAVPARSAAIPRRPAASSPPGLSSSAFFSVIAALGAQSPASGSTAVAAAPPPSLGVGATQPKPKQGHRESAPPHRVRRQFRATGIGAHSVGHAGERQRPRPGRSRRRRAGPAVGGCAERGQLRRAADTELVGAFTRAQPGIGRVVPPARTACGCARYPIRHPGRPRRRRRPFRRRRRHRSPRRRRRPCTRLHLRPLRPRLRRARARSAPDRSARRRLLDRMPGARNGNHRARNARRLARGSRRVGGRRDRAARTVLESIPA